MSTQTIEVRVGSCELIGKVLSFDLFPVTGELPAWEAGAHIDLILGDDLVRQYSLCGDPADKTRYCLAVLLEENSRGGSRTVHETVRPGAVFKIGAPRNLFPLVPSEGPDVLIGGGIGVTPLIAMAHELGDRNVPFTLHYVARDPAFAAFLQASSFADRVQIHDRSNPSTSRPDLSSVLQGIGRGHVYTCGPVALMDGVQEAALALGLTEAQIHREAFSALPISGGETFEVLAAKAGVRVQVGADEPITTALARAGVKVTVSCEQGICGTCVVDLLEGDPDHRDEYLTEDERTDQIALCCSRAKSPLLVVDL
ncbi:MAG: PDR/VanB family oxidoreductase [Acetobacter aceti]|uniref:PDR/VanB family oxidoreductase n=1 Tax=Gluconobacter oxydans TaxID=442 RepID=UPI0039E8ED18